MNKKGADLNEYLTEIYKIVYTSVIDILETSVSKFYKPYSCLLHEDVIRLELM